MKPSIPSFGASRLPLTTKMGNKDYYKGTRQAYVPGTNVRTGRPGSFPSHRKAIFKVDDTKVRFYVAPSPEALDTTRLRPYVDYAVDTAPLRRRLRLVPTAPEDVPKPERLPWDWSSPAANTNTADEFAEFMASDPSEDPDQAESDQVEPDQVEKKKTSRQDRIEKKRLKQEEAKRREAITPGALSANILPKPVKGRSGRELIESEKELLKWQARREWFARERYVLSQQEARKESETDLALAKETGEREDVAEAEAAEEVAGAEEVEGAEETGETKTEETERTSKST